ncbi:hypothetical protein SA508_09475, partial [Aggregatibacter actinomycetemcomitans serotype d str. SA508]
MRGVSGFFFRFYDPKVLRDYLTIIAKCLAKLHKFFGYDKNIIYAFASGFGDSFHYYTLKALPEDTLSAPVVMTDWEMAGLKKDKWEKTKSDLTQYILESYPTLFSENDKNVLIKYLEEGYQQGYTYETPIMQYAVAKK